MLGRLYPVVFGLGLALALALTLLGLGGMASSAHRPPGFLTGPLSRADRLVDRAVREPDERVRRELGQQAADDYRTYVRVFPGDPDGPERLRLAQALARGQVVFVTPDGKRLHYPATR